MGADRIGRRTFDRAFPPSNLKSVKVEQRFEGRRRSSRGDRSKRSGIGPRYEREREREKEDNRSSPNLTLSINLTSSSRRKGPVCPGTLPDSCRVRHRAHTRHHYLAGRASSPRDRRGTPRRPLGNTLPPLPPFHQPSSFVRPGPAIVRTLLPASLPPPPSPTRRSHSPRSTVLISFVPGWKIRL